ncbi:MAG: serine protease [Acidobacteriota bacterium]
MESFEAFRESWMGQVFLRNIVRLTKRPSYLIQADTFDVEAGDSWFQALTANRASIEAAIPSVGRVELLNHPDQKLAGTGFLVREDVIATNRHVALAFVSRQGAGFGWLPGAGGQDVRGDINFRAEDGAATNDVHLITDVLHLEADPGPDIALLRVEGVGLQPLKLAVGDPEVGDVVASIGCPWKTPQPTAELEEAMDEIFHGIFDVKRMAPGKVTDVNGQAVVHDCTNLVGSSGSALIDLERGEVVGLDYGSEVENLAVPVTVLADRLSQI